MDFYRAIPALNLGRMDCPFKFPIGSGDIFLLGCALAPDNNKDVPCFKQMRNMTSYIYTLFMYMFMFLKGHYLKMLAFPTERD